MKRMNWNWTLLCWIALFGASVQAQQGPQGPPPPPDPATRVQRRVEYFAAALKLSAAQQRQAAAIFSDADANAAAVREQLQTAHQNLRAAERENKPEQVDDLASKIGNLVARLTALQAKADMAFYQLLSPAQQSKLGEMDRRAPSGPEPF